MKVSKLTSNLDLKRHLEKKHAFCAKPLMSKAVMDKIIDGFCSELNDLNVSKLPELTNENNAYQAKLETIGEET